MTDLPGLPQHWPRDNMRHMRRFFDIQDHVRLPSRFHGERLTVTAAG